MKNRDITYFVKKISSLILILLYCTSLFANEPLDYKKIKCIIHVHTDISSGVMPLGSYAEEAKEKGISAIVLTDTDWRLWEYGLPPFRRLLKKVIQQKSVMTFGIEKYLNLIERLHESQNDVIVIDGVQTNPFYYWSGNFFKGTMVLNNRNKDMLIVGLGDADSYRDMPIVANRKSKFDPYHGDKFTQPYQDLIDYVIGKGGLIFWSHPEFEENLLKDGIRLLTVPYKWDIVGTYNYTGFGTGYKETVEPRNIWDRILMEYCRGRRKMPAWAIAEAEEEGFGKRLDEIINVLYVKELNRWEILDALKKGRFYVRYEGGDSFVLEEFTVNDGLGIATAIMGEEISSSADPIIKIRILCKDAIDENVTVKLIRNNKLIEVFSGKTPMEIEYKDEGLLKNQKYYYRANITNRSYLITNPIFFSKINSP